MSLGYVQADGLWAAPCRTPPPHHRLRRYPVQAPRLCHHPGWAARLRHRVGVARLHHRVGAARLRHWVGAARLRRLQPLQVAPSPVHRDIQASTPSH